MSDNSEKLAVSPGEAENKKSDSDDEKNSDGEKVENVKNSDVQADHESEYSYEDEKEEVPNGSRLFFDNFSHITEQYEIYNYFRKYGEICDLLILRDRNNMPKGRGFIEFMTKEEAEIALHNMDGRVIDGNKIRVDYAPAKKVESQEFYKKDPKYLDEKMKREEIRAHQQEKMKLSFQRNRNRRDEMRPYQPYRQEFQMNFQMRDSQYQDTDPPKFRTRPPMPAFGAYNQPFIMPYTQMIMPMQPQLVPVCINPSLYRSQMQNLSYRNDGDRRNEKSRNDDKKDRNPKYNRNGYY